MKRKLKRNNVTKLNRLLESARLNDVSLSFQLECLRSHAETKRWQRAAKKFGTHLEWDSAEFDAEQGWLFVPLLIDSAKWPKDDHMIQVFQAKEDIPAAQQHLWSA